MKPLVIVGAGGLGREIAFLVEEINSALEEEASRWNLLGFVDDRPSLNGRRVQELPVLGTTAWLRRQSKLRYVLAIGAPATRQRLAGRLASSGLRAATLLHPSVSIHATTKLAEGCLLCQGATPTVNVSLGAHVLVNLHATIGHDAVVVDYATLHPGVHLSGNSRVGTEAEIGTGAVVLPGVTVGPRTTVGAGAVVHRDLPADVTAVGVPAHPLNA